MKQFFIQLNVAIILLLIFSFHCMGAEKYTLEYNFEKGKTYKQHVVSEMNMTMNAMGQDITMTMRSEMVINYDVIAQNKDVYDIRMTYQNIKMDMSAPTPFSIDSNSPENSSDKGMGNAIKALMGVSLDVQLNKQGKVLSIQGIDKLVEKIDSTNNVQFKQMFTQLFSEKMIQQTIEQSSSYFPDKPVAIGDSWNNAIDISVNGIDIVNKMTLTLKQVKDKVATVELTGVLSTPEGGSVMNIQGMDAKVSMNGEQTGTIQLNMKTGWLVLTEINQKSAQDIEVMGQTMHQDVEVKATVTGE